MLATTATFPLATRDHWSCIEVGRVKKPRRQQRSKLRTRFELGLSTLPDPSTLLQHLSMVNEDVNRQPDECVNFCHGSF
jgi:hypothetical protein